MQLWYRRDSHNKYKQFIKRRLWDVGQFMQKTKVTHEQLYSVTIYSYIFIHDMGKT